MTYEPRDMTQIHSTRKRMFMHEKLNIGDKLYYRSETICGEN